MSEIRNKLQEVNNPAIMNRRSFTTVGRILEINEKQNTCKVQYIDNLGYYKTRENVYVKLFAPGFIGWFPKVDEAVEITLNESNILITGPYSYDYSKTSGQVKLNKDILYENKGGTICGSIF